MTSKQALKEAQKRWGKYGAVRQDKPSAQYPNRLTHTVGTIMLGLFFEVKGQGKSWEESFADAEKKGRGGSAVERKINDSYGAPVRGLAENLR